MKKGKINKKIVSTSALAIMLLSAYGISQQKVASNTSIAHELLNEEVSKESISETNSNGKLTQERTNGVSKLQERAEAEDWEEKLSNIKVHI